MAPQLGGKRKRQVKYLPHFRVALHRQRRPHSADVQRSYHLVPLLAILVESGDSARYVDAEPAASASIASLIAAWQVAIHSTLIDGLGVLDCPARGSSIGRFARRAGPGSRSGVGLAFVRRGLRTQRQIHRRPGRSHAEPIIVVTSLAAAVQYSECLARSSQGGLDPCELVQRYHPGQLIRRPPKHRYGLSVSYCDLVAIARAFEPENLVVSGGPLDSVQEAIDLEQRLPYSAVSIRVGGPATRPILDQVTHTCPQPLFSRM